MEVTDREKARALIMKSINDEKKVTNGKEEEKQ